jgi:hypothetical protein
MLRHRAIPTANLTAANPQFTQTRLRRLPGEQ